MAEPKEFTIVTPAAASRLWQISDARMRRLAIDGKLPFRIVTNIGPKPTRCYDYDSLVERWGYPPDPDRMVNCQRLTAYNIGEKRGTIWTILTLRAHVYDQEGKLAFDFDKD